jgi:hypothetical protein
MSNKTPLNIDHLLQDVHDRFGYTRTGWSYWAKEAQTLYHKEVVTYEAIVEGISRLDPERKEAAREKVQKDYNKWVLDNKDRITSICETKYPNI